MKKSLRNTVRTLSVEACSFRPANNKTIYRGNDKWFKEINTYSSDNPMLILRTIMQFTWVGRRDIYKLRLVYTYWTVGSSKRKERRGRKKVKTVRSPYFYVAGTVVSKQKAIDYFSFSPEKQEEVKLFNTEKVFWCNYVVEPFSEKSNYDYLALEKNLN